MTAEPGRRFRVAAVPLEVDEAVRLVAGPDRGAVAVFIGTARDQHDGRRVLSLEYDAYVPMAEKVLEEIGRAVGAEHGAPHVAILHRIGPVPIGEASVVVAVASPHRREALAACADAIERLKRSAPIWKKERYADGAAAWIEGP